MMPKFFFLVLLFAAIFFITNCIRLMLDNRQGKGRLIQCIIILVIVAGLCSYVVFERRKFSKYFKKQRIAYAKAASGPIDVAVLRSKEKSGFVDGVALAIDELNATGGIEIEMEEQRLSHRLIRLHVFDEQPKNRTPRSIAEEPSIVAVFAERTSQEITASVTFEYNGLLFLAPMSSDYYLTHHGFQYVFSMHSLDNVIARSLVEFARTENMKKIVLLRARSEYGRNFSHFFKRCIELAERMDSDKTKSIEILYENTYAPESDNYRLFAVDLLKHPSDAIVIADSEMEHAYRLINAIRESGNKKPILSGHILDKPEFWDKVESAKSEVYVASNFSLNALDRGNAIGTAFVKSFKSRYKKYPDYAATQGYEAVMIVSQAWRAGASFVPSDVSSMLKAKSEWKGLYGPCSFMRNGAIHGKKVFVKTKKKGQLVKVWEFFNPDQSVLSGRNY